jgi:ubiquitin-protein ligase
MDAPSASAEMAHAWRVLRSQHAAYMRDPLPNLLVYPDPEKCHVWYWLVVGLEAPYRGGEYLFCLTAGPEFPKKPPRFEFLTNSGVFQPGGPICISVGEFHERDKPGKSGAYGWRPSLGMRGFAAEVVNGMICASEEFNGIRIEVVSPALREMYAKASRAANERAAPDLARAFDRILADHPDLEPCRNALRARAGGQRAEGQSGGPGREPRHLPAAATGFVCPPLSGPAGENVGLRTQPTTPPAALVAAPVAAPPAGQTAEDAPAVGMTDAEVDDLLGSLL